MHSWTLLDEGPNDPKIGPKVMLLIQTGHVLGTHCLHGKIESVGVSITKFVPDKRNSVVIWLITMERVFYAVPYGIKQEETRQKRDQRTCEARDFCGLHLFSGKANLQLLWGKPKTCLTWTNVQREAGQGTMPTLSPMDLHEARGLPRFTLHDGRFQRYDSHEGLQHGTAHPMSAASVRPRSAADCLIRSAVDISHPRQQ